MSGLRANSSSLVVGRLVVAALGWFGTILIARQLQPEQFGQFTLVFTLLGMLSIVTDLGVGRLAITGMLDDTRDKETFAGSYVVLRTVMGVFGYTVALAVVFIAQYPTVVQQATALAGLGVLLATPSSAYNVAFQVHNKLRPLAIAPAVGRFGQAALIVALVIRGGTLLWFVVPSVLAELGILIWKRNAAHKLVGFRYRVDLASWRTLLVEAVPLSLGAAFATLYYRVDLLMLSKLDTFEAVGAYGVAYKFVDLVHFMPTAVAMSLIAPLAAAWPNHMAEFREQCSEAFRMLLSVAGLIAVGFWLFSTDVTVLLYGEVYRSAGTATAVVVSAECLAFASKVALTALIAAGRHRFYPIITLAGVALNIGLNTVLIPKYSFEGAAVATLCTEVLVLVGFMVLFAKLGGFGFRETLGSTIYLPIAAGASLVAGFIVSGVTFWVVGAIVTVGVYLGVGRGLRVFPLRSGKLGL